MIERKKAVLVGGFATTFAVLGLWGATYFNQPVEAHRLQENVRQEERRTFQKPRRGFNMAERCKEEMEEHQREGEDMDEHMREHMSGGMGMMGGMMGE